LNLELFDDPRQLVMTTFDGPLSRWDTENSKASGSVADAIGWADCDVNVR